MYGKYKCFNLFLIGILKFFVNISTFVCVCILVDLSKNNPFETHIIGNLTDYFYYEVPVSQEIKYNNSLNSSLSKREFYFNVSKNTYTALETKQKLFLRRLVSQSYCLEIRDKFERFKGSKLSNIFDFNYNKIHNISIASLILECVGGFLYVVFLSSSCISLIFQKDCNIFILVFSYFLILLGIAKFILSSVILFYFMEKGDLEKYDDFLDCKNVKVHVFKKISDINKLRKCFYAFVILNMIELGIDKFEKIMDCGEKIQNIMEGDNQKARIYNIPEIQNKFGKEGSQAISQNLSLKVYNGFLNPNSTKNILNEDNNKSEINFNNNIHNK